jgi:hypothetical protein
VEMPQDGCRIRDGSFIRVVRAFEYGSKDVGESAELAGHVSALKDVGWSKGRDLRSYLLPHVADHMGTGRDAMPSDSHISESLRLTPKAVRRLLGTDSFAIEPRHKTVTFAVTDCEITLFRFGIGFLSVEVIPDGNEVPDWNDACHYLRFYEEPGAVDGNRQCQFVGTESGVSNVGMLMDRLLEPIAIQERPRSLWRPGQMFGYVSIIVDGSQGDEQRLFESYYRFRRFFHRDSAVYATQDQQTDLQPEPLQYARDAFLFHSLDGGGIVCLNPPDIQFFNNTLQDHARGPYFVGFMVAMHTRLLLARISSELIQRWNESIDLEGRLRSFAETKRLLIEVVARCSFVQIMYTDNHHANYRRWYEVLGVDRFQNEVTREVDNMYDYLFFATEERASQQREASEDRAERAERTLTIGGLGFAFCSLLLAFLGVNVDGWTTSSGGLRFSFAVVAALFALCVGIAVGFGVVRRRFSKASFEQGRNRKFRKG